MRHLLTIFTALLAFMSSSIASGVTQEAKLTNSGSAMVSVTTVAAAKAQTEVQIRRLHRPKRICQHAKKLLSGIL